MAVNGVALASVATGSVFLYSGVKGFSIPQAVQYIVQGKSPATLPQATKVDTPVELPTAGSSATVGGGSASGVAIATDALRYKGAGYVWGGNASSTGKWDCSSFVFKVLAQDMGMTVLGHKWGDAGVPPNAHGPTAAEYAGAGQGISRAQVQAGDLLVWPHHIGIAISNTSMISAQDQRLGTGVSSIDGTSRYFGRQPNCRRVSS